MKSYFGKPIAETAGEALSLRCALVVWDMQNSIAPRALEYESLTGAIVHLRSLAHDADVPVVYSQHFSLPVPFESAGYADGRWRSSKLPSPELLRPLALWGSPEGQIVEPLTPRPLDIVLPKTRIDFFYGTPLSAVLHNLGVQTLVFTGVAVDQGILYTARQALLHGFQCVLLRGCASSFTPEALERGFDEFEAIGHLASVAQVEDAWKADT